MGDKINYFHSVPTISDEDIEAVVSVLKQKHLEDGEIVEELENAMRKIFSRKYAIATNNGFSAIHLALIGLNVSCEDEVILPSYSCPALLNPILLQKAIPVVVDIEANSFNISIEGVKDKINKRTKAIIVPHLFGFPARIDEINGLGIPVIEDCAQSIGGKYKNKKLGTFSDISIFSFYATKMICAGDGGMILTDDKNLFEKIRNYRYYGHKRNHRYVAYNYHMTNLPAALAISQLKRIDKFIEARKQIAQTYDSCFANIDSIKIDFKNKEDSIYYRYPIKVAYRDFIKKNLRKKRIFTGFGVLEGMHQLMNLNAEDFSNTEDCLKNILSLPIYPSLSIDQAILIAKEVLNSI